VKRRWTILAGVALLVPLAYRRCAPPAVLRATVLPRELALAHYPAERESVELVNANGTRLAGVFVPTDPGAPVVLHLLDASASFASAALDLGALTAELADLGCASLVVDYSGVGHSEGSRSTRHLAADARAAWDEAVRRAGGPERVLVRALSLGTLATATLLAGGARPAAVVLVAPVLPESVVPRFGQVLFGLPGRWVGSYFEPVVALDPCKVLERSGVPCTVVLPDEDELLTDAEQARFRELAEASGGSAVSTQGGHVLVSFEARRLFAGELELYRARALPDVPARLARLLESLEPEIAARFPPGSEERARLAELAAVQRHARAPLVAAAALGSVARLGSGDALASARWLWLVRRRPYETMPFESWVAALSLEDPSGPLPIAGLEAASRRNDLARSLGWGLWNRNAHDVGRMASMHEKADRSTVECELQPAWYFLGGGFQLRIVEDHGALWSDLLDEGASVADAERRFARLLLKTYRIPECLDTAGIPRIEVWGGERWTQLSIAEEALREQVFELQLQLLSELVDERLRKSR
jgi:serine aminopeptidase S33 family